MAKLERLNLTTMEVLGALDTDESTDKTTTGMEISLELKNLLVRARLEDFQNKIFDQFKPVLMSTFSARKPHSTHTIIDFTAEFHKIIEFLE